MAEQSVIDTLAPRPRWYRYRFLLAGLTLLAIAAILTAERTGLTAPRLDSSGSSFLTTFPDPASGDGAAMEFVVANEGRFAATIESVDQPRGTQLAIEVQTRAADGTPRPLDTLPVDVPAGDAVTMMLSFDRIDCAEIEPDLATLTLRAAPALGPTRSVELAVPATAERTRTSATAFADEGGNDLGWPAFMFERFCPEITE